MCSWVKESTRDGSKCEVNHTGPPLRHFPYSQVNCNTSYYMVCLLFNHEGGDGGRIDILVSLCPAGWFTQPRKFDGALVEYGSHLLLRVRIASADSLVLDRRVKPLLSIVSLASGCSPVHTDVRLGRLPLMVEVDTELT